MIEQIVNEFLLEILIFVVTGLVGYLIRQHNNYKNKIDKTEEKQRRIENRLYGFETDETDEGFISRTDSRLEENREDIEQIRKDTQDIKSDIEFIKHKLEEDE